MKTKKRLAVLVSIVMLVVVLMGCDSIRGGGWFTDKDGNKITLAFTAKTGELMPKDTVTVDGMTGASLYKAKGNFQLVDHANKYVLHGDVLYQKGFTFPGVNGGGLIAFVDTDKDKMYDKLIVFGGYDDGEGNQLPSFPFDPDGEYAPGYNIKADALEIEIFRIAPNDGTEPVDLLDGYYEDRFGRDGLRMPKPERVYLSALGGVDISSTVEATTDPDANIDAVGGHGGGNIQFFLK